MMAPSAEPWTEKTMSQPVNSLELALRLRRDAEETCMPEYADLMRRAATELEALVRSDDSADAERKAG
jgi:hypothetical protein